MSCIFILLIYEDRDFMLLLLQAICEKKGYFFSAILLYWGYIFFYLNYILPTITESKALDNDTSPTDAFYSNAWEQAIKVSGFLYSNKRLYTTTTPGI